MHIQYYLVDGQEISYTTNNQLPSLQDVDAIALMHAKMRPTTLPDTCFVSVSIYREFMAQFFYMGAISNSTALGVQQLQIHTAVGLLMVRVMPMCCDAKLFLIGREDDYQRYNLDKVFEETVLKDCEKV